MEKVLKSLEIIEKETAKIRELLAQSEATTEGGDVDYSELSDKELKKMAKDAGIPIGRSFDRDAVIAALEEHFAEDEEESEEDGGQDFESMSDDELKEAAEEAGLDVDDYIKGKGKKAKLDREALIAALQESEEESEEDESEEESEDDDSEDEEEEDSEDDDDEESGSYDEESLNEMSEDELKEVCEELGIEPVVKKKKLDKKATIAAILEAQEADEEDEEDQDDDEDDDEDESEEEGLSTYEEEDLDELDEDELKEHLNELGEYADEYGYEMPKGWQKLKGETKLKKAILEVYAQLEDE